MHQKNIQGGSTSIFFRKAFSLQNAGTFDTICVGRQLINLSDVCKSLVRVGISEVFLFRSTLEFYQSVYHFNTKKLMSTAVGRAKRKAAQ